VPPAPTVQLGAGLGWLADPLAGVAARRVASPPTGLSCPHAAVVAGGEFYRRADPSVYATLAWRRIVLATGHKPRSPGHFAVARIADL
jgi:hypothetical protein